MTRPHLSLSLSLSMCLCLCLCLYLRLDLDLGLRLGVSPGMVLQRSWHLRLSRQANLLIDLATGSKQPDLAVLVANVLHHIILARKHSHAQLALEVLDTLVHCFNVALAMLSSYKNAPTVMALKRPLGSLCNRQLECLLAWHIHSEFALLGTVRRRARRIGNTVLLLRRLRRL